MAIALIKRLIDTRANEWDEMQKILDRAEEESRDLSAEEQEQSEKATRSIGELDERITDLTDLEKRNKDFEEQRTKYQGGGGPGGGGGGGGLPVGGGTPDEPTVADQFRALAKSEINEFDLDITGIIREVDRDGRIQYRDLSKLTAAAGGDTVPTSFARKLYEHIVENSAIRRTNATIITTATGENMDFPKTTGLTTAALIAEAAAITESDPTFAKVTLGAFKFAVATQASFELLIDTAVDLEGFLAKDLGRAVVDDMGEDFIVGDGTNKPNGVVTASTLGVTSATGTSGVFTADDLIDLQYSVIEAYAMRGFWMMRRASEGKTRKLKGSDNNYLWAPGLVVGTPNTLLSRPVVNDPNMAATALNAKSVLFGDFSTYYIRDVGTVRIARSDDFAFLDDLATFKAVLRSDGDLVDVTGSVKHFLGAAS